MAALLGGAGAAHADNLIRNGGFDARHPDRKGAVVYTNPPTAHDHLSGWKVVGDPGNVAVLGRDYMQDGILLQPHKGRSSLNLAGTSHTVTGVQQIVATVPHKTYLLTFWVGNVVDPANGLGSTSTVVVTWSNTLMYQVTNSQGAGAGKVVWQKFTRSILATGPRTTLDFINFDPAHDGYCGLDRVSFEPVP